MAVIHTMDKDKGINQKLIVNNFFENINFVIYKSKHLFIYITIGIISLIVELSLRKYLLGISESILINYICLFFGISLAFILNIKLNFNIPQKFFYRSLFYFFLISLISFFTQEFLKNIIVFENFTYNQKRIYISSLVFIFAYILHLKFTFKSTIKVGVAIYANGIEDVNKIYNKIGKYPDFIHVDIVDETYLTNYHKPKTHKLEVIKAYWPFHKIHVHIMSKYPSRYIDDAIKYCDFIYIHYEINEKIEEIIKKVNKSSKQIGIVLHAENEYPNLDVITKLSQNILILSIKKPGFSGQNFMNEALELISSLNNIKNKTKINLCVDGGINRSNISKISADQIVSGSSVLKNKKPIRQIMIMQTLSRYER